MSPTVPPHRSTGRAGVNAARTLFEKQNYVFQEVHLDNDFGKDAYVDLVDGREVTGLCVALQIKSGESFKRASGYAIPIEGHLEVWRNSTLPIAGVVFDPTDGNLYWCDITGYLNGLTGEPPATIPVPIENILNAVTLEQVFKPRIRELAGRRSVGTSLLQLCSSKTDEQIAAMSDCFAVGRYEPRVLIVLRYMMMMLEGETLVHAIHILSHVTPHPDIFWTPNNWFPQRVCDAVVAHFVWNQCDIRKLFSATEGKMWERGEVTQSLYMLLSEDKNIAAKMEEATKDFYTQGCDELAFRAMYLVLYWSDDAIAKYIDFIEKCPGLRELEMIPELELLLWEHGEVWLFE